MTSGELIIVVEQELKALATNFVAVDYSNAVEDAVRETSYVLPNTNNEQIYWLKQRTKRNMVFMLATGVASSFQVKQIKLDQKFRNLKELYVDMDRVWKEAQGELGIGVSDVFKLFGSKVDAGFASDELTGEDTTYDAEQLVIVTPNDTE